MQSVPLLKLLMLALLASAGALPGKAAGKGAGGLGAKKTPSPAAAAVSIALLSLSADFPWPCLAYHPSIKTSCTFSAGQAALRHDEVVLCGWAAQRDPALQGAPTPSQRGPSNQISPNRG